MKLDREYCKFMRRLEQKSNEFSSFCAQLPSTRKTICTKEIYNLEGMINSLWLHFCRFNRSVFMNSCRGTLTRNGMLTLPVQNPNTEARLSYCAIRIKSGKPIQPTGENLVLRSEPTWGDVDVFERIVRETSPTNQNSLLNALLINEYPKRLQLLRNAIAHPNKETTSNLYNFSAHYLANKIRQPCEVALWTDSKTKDYFYITCIDDLKIYASLMTE